MNKGTTMNISDRKSTVTNNLSKILRKKMLTLRNTLGVAAMLFITACSNNDNESTPDTMSAELSFKVTVVNNSENQPLSPIAVLFHRTNDLFNIGQPASEALELMAESGDNSMLLNDIWVNSAQSGLGVILPGQSESITVTIPASHASKLSVATMLVNTNDAFSGVSSFDISAMSVSDSESMSLPVYDAGTEANSEMMGTIPGPADGGEGFNSERDDLNKVSMHPGVVSQDDGLTLSVLKASHRFDNPMLLLTVERIE